MTALYFAACSGKIQMAQLLLKKSRKVDDVTNIGYTPLMATVQNDNLDIVKL